MTTPLKINSCPTSPVPGADRAASLERAFERTGAGATADIHFQPFELNRRWGPRGRTLPSTWRRSRITREQLVRNQEAIRARGAALGFTFE